MRKFWKESRVLTIALSLVLCCLVGIVGAEWMVPCFNDGPSCDPKYNDAMVLGELAGITISGLEDALGTDLFALGDIIECHGSHDGAEDEGEYSSLLTAAILEIGYAEGELSNAGDELVFGCGRITCGILECTHVTYPDHVQAKAEFDAAGFCFGQAAIYSEYGMSHHAAAFTKLGLSFEELKSRIWLEEMQMWMECNCNLRAKYGFPD